MNEENINEGHATPHGMPHQGNIPHGIQGLLVRPVAMVRGPP